MPSSTSYVPLPDGTGTLMDSRATFMQHGPFLEICNLQVLPDGCLLVETVGRERFSIQEWSVQDEYIVGKTYRLYSS